MKACRTMKTQLGILLCAVLLLGACGRVETPVSEAPTPEVSVAETPAGEAASSTEETSMAAEVGTVSPTPEAKAPLLDSVEIRTEHEMATAQFLAMDTVMDITVYGPDAKEALEDCVYQIDGLARALSAEDESAELYQLNESGFRSCSSDLMMLVAKAQWLAEDMNGAFNIALCPVKKAWGFGDRNYRVPAAAEIEALLKKADPAAAEILELPSYEWPNLPPEDYGDGEGVTLQEGIRYGIEGMALDLGGIAKGYTADVLTGRLERYDVTGALANLGGNVLTYGKKPDGKPWKIGVKDPEGGTDPVGVVTLDILSSTDAPLPWSVVTSGTYERFFEQDGKRYHHILDPATGYPAESGLVSATIVAQDATEADALSTAAIVLGKEGAIDLWRNGRFDFGMILIDTEGNIYVTEDLNGVFATERPMEMISFDA